jgi:uncharacterized membrane protein
VWISLHHLQLGVVTQVGTLFGLDLEDQVGQYSELATGIITALGRVDKFTPPTTVGFFISLLDIKKRPFYYIFVLTNIPTVVGGVNLSTRVRSKTFWVSLVGILVGVVTQVDTTIFNSFSIRVL